jgi:flagellar biosynthesis/type III secretory pathway chaperone
MTTKQSDSVTKLLQALQQLLAIYRDLIKCAEDKRNVLIAGQDDQLHQLTNRESELLNQFAQADQSRIEAVSEIQTFNGVAVNQHTTLTEIGNLLTDEQARSALRDVQQQLIASARQLQSLNERNLLLLKQDMAMTSDRLDTILGRPIESEYTYEHPNAEASSVKRTKGIDFRY